MVWGLPYTLLFWYVDSSVVIIWHLKKHRLFQWRFVKIQGNEHENAAAKCRTYLFMFHWVNSLWPSDTMSLVNIGWGNGLLPNGKPLLEPMMTNHQLGLLASEANFTRNVRSWWRHQMEGVFLHVTGPLLGEFPSQRASITFLWYGSAYAVKQTV